jgi:hypothetical protein
MRDLICLVAASLALSASTASAAEPSVFAEARNLCIANHGAADKVLSAADAQGWTRPQGATDGTMRTRTLGADTRTLVAISKSDPGGGQAGDAPMQADVCLMTAKVAGPDIKAAARDFMGGQTPIADQDGGWFWVFVDTGGARHFLADKEKATLMAAVKDGPVVVLAAASGADGDKVVYVQLRQGAR